MNLGTAGIPAGAAVGEMGLINDELRHMPVTCVPSHLLRRAHQGTFWQMSPSAHIGLH
ncbi:MAG: hypothetical protein ACK4K7_12645 [Allosphingosinicella sp.]|uniref:hypothetical protein n=1 Tax=Allosphingosinicella sp. TaxID=2823234 RepID=UPI003935FA62